jgi:peptidoglycan-N-acetylglucosamine deacetylase
MLEGEEDVSGGEAIGAQASGGAGRGSEPAPRRGLRSRWIALGALLLLALAAGAVWKAARSTRWQLFGELVWQGPGSERAIALTFDDGPGEETDRILRVLDEHGARGTFFVIGEGVATHRAEARRIVEAGHELGNHSYSHRRMVFKSDAFIRGEIEQTDALIREAGFEGEIFFRPPYGKKLVGLPLYLERTHRRTVMWTTAADADASGGAEPKSIARSVLDQARPGGIILFHVWGPFREPERQALPEVIDGLKEKGFRLVSVSELLSPPSTDRYGQSAP